MFQGLLLVSETAWGQYIDTKVKIDHYGIGQIENKGHLCRHYVDSIPGIFLQYMKGGSTEEMSQAQLNLGYFKFVLLDESFYDDHFYLLAFDSLYPSILSACKEFGFFEFVNVFDEIHEHRNQHTEFFQNDTTGAIFNTASEQFDQELYDLRQKFYRLRDEYYFNEVYVEVTRKYILEHKEELLKY